MQEEKQDALAGFARLFASGLSFGHTIPETRVWLLLHKLPSVLSSPQPKPHKTVACFPFSHRMGYGFGIARHAKMIETCKKFRRAAKNWRILHFHVLCSQQMRFGCHDHPRLFRDRFNRWIYQVKSKLSHSYYKTTSYKSASLLVLSSPSCILHHGNQHRDAKNAAKNKSLFPFLIRFTLFLSRVPYSSNL